MVQMRLLFVEPSALKLEVPKWPPLFWDVTQCGLVVVYRRFDKRLSLNVVRPTLRSIPEERRAHLHRDESLKSRTTVPQLI